MQQAAFKLRSWMDWLSLSVHNYFIVDSTTSDLTVTLPRNYKQNRLKAVMYYVWKVTVFTRKLFSPRIDYI